MNARAANVASRHAPKSSRSSRAPMSTMKTPSGIEIPESLAGYGSDRVPEAPGMFPFTRGIHKDGYRGRLWTIRQYSGFGTADETNKRFKYLLSSGNTGLSVAFDLPSQCGMDPVDPLARAEVGRVGVSVSTLQDMETVFEGIDLADVSVSFTINGTAAIMYAMYLATADKQGVQRENLKGTLQNDILKEFAARGTWIFPAAPSLRLVSDVILFSSENTPQFNPISISGGHFHEAGCTSVEEQAYMIANAITYIDEVVRRGGDPAQFAQRLTFLSCIHMEFFEEICKLRASRRIWARLIRERYGIEDERAQRFRIFTSSGGCTLTAAQPLNNVVRVAYQAMAAALGSTQCIFTMAYDEAYQLPTESSAELALRTQQILAYETGITKTVDPLGGSYFVEWLTDELEKQILSEIDNIDAYGGMVKAVEDGWLQRRIAHRALERKQSADSGERVVVGENWFRNEEQVNEVAEVFNVDDSTSKQIVDRYHKVIGERDPELARKTMDALRTAVASDEFNIIPSLVDCCHAYVTVGEMVSCMKDKWGNFDEPAKL